MEWISDHGLNRLWSSQVVNQSTDWETLTTNGTAFPNTKPSDDSKLFKVVEDDP